MPFWDFQAGLRHDFEPNPTRDWAVIGVHGLLPYYVEIDASLFLGEGGQTGVRVEAEHEFLLTQRLVLTPRVEINAYSESDAEVGLGSGLNEIELGLRLRYEIKREIAPYAGLGWFKKTGAREDFARAHDRDTQDLRFVLGLRAWF